MSHPVVLVSVQGGMVVQASTNIHSLGVRVLDLDLVREGKPASADVAVRPYGMPLFPDLLEQQPQYLTPSELERLENEMNTFSKVGVMRAMNAATASIPGATAAIRAWLAGAEAETREGDENPEDSPDYDSGLNHLVRNGPWT